MRIQDLEENIIITLLNYPQEAPFVCGKVAPDMFTTDKHRAVYSAMYRLWSDGIEITVGNLMVSGHDVEAYLFKSDKSSTDGEFLVTKYLDAYRNHIDVEYAQKVHREAVGGGDVATVKGEWEARLALIDDAGSIDPYEKYATTLITRIDNRKQGKLITGIRTGFYDIDSALSGWQNQDLIIIGATPSVGKTALGLFYVMKALDEGIPVGIISVEMSFGALMNRILAYRTEINSMHIRDGYLQDGQSDKLIAELERIKKEPLFIEDNATTMEKIRARMIDMATTHHVKLFLVDYIQLITWGARKESRRVAVGDVGLELKRIAKKLQVPVIALSQLSRLKGAGPQLDDLKESGDLEAHADVVQLLNHASDNRISINMAKNRNGEIATYHKVFKKPINKFFDEDFAAPF